MKIVVKVQKEIQVKTLHVKANVRYWEDSYVDGVEDETGSLMPCRNGDNWEPIVDIDSGQITNWKKGVTAEVHYKVCDEGEYIIKDEDGESILSHEGYVRGIMCPKENGFGDYIIMDIDKDGFIQDWNNDVSDFYNEDED